MSFWYRKARLRLAAVLSLILAANLAVALPAVGAAPKRAWPNPQHLKPVSTMDAAPTAPVTNVAARLAAAAPVPAAPVWPTAASMTYDLATAPKAATGLAARSGTLGGLSVTVASAGSATPGRSGIAAAGVTPGKVRVDVLDQASLIRSGRRGLAVRVSRADGVSAAGRVALTVSYAQVAGAFGADWTRRLRLEALPECGLTTPGVTGCAGVPLGFHNDPATRTLTADVGLPGSTVAPRTATSADVAAGGSVLLVASAGSSSVGGDYTATSLQPSATWSGGQATGDFTWNYPLRVPPSLGGPSPTVALTYSSQSVDGLTSASNTQGSWVGDGFGYSPGFIERSYNSCVDDGQAGKADRCWGTDNATLSLSGMGGELIQVSTSPDVWRPVHDDGTRIERLRDTSKNNGDNDGEFWKLTTTTGMQYFFGVNRLPSTASGRPETNSVFYAPVAGDDAGEPCNGATFASSFCQQAYRWNLDYIVDTHQNTASYWYAQDVNWYGQNGATAVGRYVRSGYLTRIDYDTDNRSGTDSTFTGTAPARVLFTTQDRCAASCTTHDAAHWPDVPWDQECVGTGGNPPASCASRNAPTFWSTQRLATVTTQVATGTQTWKDVERWSLGVQWLDPSSGDGGKIMWLTRISHTGLNGTAPDVAVPDVVIGPTATTMLNRVHNTDGNGAFNRFRIATIATESGAVLGVAYSAPDCVWGSKMPAAPESNAYRCFPVYWTPPGGSQILDYYHKYVVTSVTVADNVAGNPTEATSYTYPTDGAFWHYDESELTPQNKKAWAQWRGYEQVTVTKGATGGTQSQRVSKYFRGMNGDKLPSGTRSKSYVVNGTTYADENWHAGTEWESTVYNGVGGPVVTDTLTEPWQQGPTATRTRNGVTVSAYATNTLRTTTLTKLDNSRADRRSVITNTFTDGSDGTPPGRIVAVDDEGDTSTAADDVCTRTAYARNDATFLFGLVAEVETTGLHCSASPTQADQVLSDRRTWYDNGATYPTTPGKGDVTKVQELSVWNATPASRQYVTSEHSTYDACGRVLDRFDALDRKTSTAYTPTTGAPVTAVSVTNPALWTTSTVVDPAWGLPTKVTDQNSRVTDLDYDALGRLTAQWRPGWSKAAHPSLPNQGYAYLVRSSGGPSVITTNTLNAAGTGTLASFQLFDADLRMRQTQTLAAGSVGRVITDAFYDSRALQTKTNAPYYATGQPDSTLQVTSDSAIPSQTRTTYDGAARTTVTALVSQSVEKWRTTLAYGGDRTDTTPPAGGTATSTVADARGKQIELRQYTGSTPTPYVPTSYARTTFTYDHAGRMTAAVDPAGVTWQWGFDQRGRTVSHTDPDKGTTTSTYDDADQLVTTTDARGILLGYTYDQLGRRRTEWRDAITTGTKLADWTYDTATDTAAIAGHAMYGQLGSTTRWVAGTAYVTAIAGYDVANRATGIVVTVPSVETGLAGTYTFGMTYNPDGSVATTSLPAAGGLPAETLTTGYTATGLPYTLTGLTPYVSDTTYLETGQITSLTNNTTVSYQGFNSDPTTMRLASTNVQANTFPDILADVRFTYDPAGNITQVANMLAQYGTGYGADDTQCFTYDNLRRLTQAWTPATNSCTAAPSVASLGGAAPYWLSWSFDATGNRTGQTRHTAGGDQITTSTYPAPTAARPHALTATSGAVTGSYTYDATSNTTSRPGPTGQQTLTWDAEGHLATLAEGTSTSTYLYDADGGRLVTHDATGATLHLPYGMEVHVNPSGGNAVGTRPYSHDGTVVASRTAGTGLFWMFADRQGTAGLALRDSDMAISRRWQAPYGTARGTTTSWPNQHGYLGGFTDASALVHLGARDYDSAAGRFLSLDPVQDLDDPQQWNGYAYSGNSPITFSDPTGLEHDEEAGPGYQPPSLNDGGPTGRTRDEEYQPQPVNNGGQTGRTRDEHQWVPAPKPASGPSSTPQPMSHPLADGKVGPIEGSPIDAGPMTWGECVAGDAQAGYGVSVSFCHVQDSLGNEAMLMITVVPGDAYATPGLSVVAGGMLANGSIADQAEYFQFVTVSWGEGVSGAVTYAWGTGNECHCAVKSVFAGGGVGIGGGVAYGRSYTDIAWIHHVA